MGKLEDWVCGGRGSSTNCSSPFAEVLEAAVLRDPEAGPEAEDSGVVGVELVPAGSVAAEVATPSLGGAATDAFVVAGEFWAASCADCVVVFLPRKRAAAPKSVAAITTITAASFQLPVGRFGATDQSGSLKVGRAAAFAGDSSSHGVLNALEVLGKGWLEAILPGPVLCGEGTTGSTTEVAGAMFGALMPGVPMFDIAAAGILGILAGFTDGGSGITPETGARCFPTDGGGCLLGETVGGGTFANDGLGDWLSTDGTVGCGFSEIASGEI